MPTPKKTAFSLHSSTDTTMRIIALCLWILFSYAGLKAQRVAGLTQDDRGKPLVDASVALKNYKDSSVVKLSISNTSGEYEFAPVVPGVYFVTVSHIGYSDQSSASCEGAARLIRDDHRRNCCSNSMRRSAVSRETSPDTRCKVVRRSSIRRLPSVLPIPVPARE